MCPYRKSPYSHVNLITAPHHRLLETSGTIKSMWYLFLHWTQHLWIFFSVCTMYDAILRNKSLHIVKHSHCKRPHLPVFIKVNEGKESWDWNFSIRKIWHLKLSEDNRCHVYIYCWWLKIQFTIFLLFLWVIDGRREVDWPLLLRRNLLPALGFRGSWLGLKSQSPVYWDVLPC